MYAEPGYALDVGALQRIRRLPVIRSVVAVQDRYAQVGAGYLASAIAFHGFFSLFPLLLVGMSAIGFVLDDPATQGRLIDGLAATLPGLEPLIEGTVEALVAARGATGLIGLAGLVWTGTAGVRAAGQAMQRVFGLDRRKGFVGTNLWALGTLALLGSMALAATGLSFTGTLLPVAGATRMLLRVVMIAAAAGNCSGPRRVAAGATD